MGRGRARSGGALPRRPPRRRARMEHRPRLGAQRARAGVRHRESRCVREGDETRQAHKSPLAGLLAGVAALLAAAAAGAMLAVIQRGEARDAETGQLVQRLGAQALVEDDLDLSLLLARQAVAIDDSPQTRGYLLAALRRSPAAIGIMHGGGGVLRGIAISPDGKTLAVA